MRELEKRIAKRIAELKALTLPASSYDPLRYLTDDELHELRRILEPFEFEQELDEATTERFQHLMRLAYQRKEAGHSGFSA